MRIARGITNAGMSNAVITTAIRLRFEGRSTDVDCLSTVTKVTVT